MKGSEKQMWAWLRPHLAPYLRMQRIENVVGEGTPDIFFTARARCGWLELKYRAQSPQRDTTPLFTAATGMRRSQLAWINRFHAANTHIILRAGCQLWCVPGGRAHQINGMSAAALTAICTVHFPSIRGLRAVHWDTLSRVVSHPEA